MSNVRAGGVAAPVTTSKLKAEVASSQQHDNIFAGWAQMHVAHHKLKQNPVQVLLVVAANDFSQCALRPRHDWRQVKNFMHTIIGFEFARPLRHARLGCPPGFAFPRSKERLGVPKVWSGVRTPKRTTPACLAGKEASIPRLRSAPKIYHKPTLRVVPIQQ